MMKQIALILTSYMVSAAMEHPIGIEKLVPNLDCKQIKDCH